MQVNQARGELISQNPKICHGRPFFGAFIKTICANFELTLTHAIKKCPLPKNVFFKNPVNIDNFHDKSEKSNIVKMSQSCLKERLKRPK